MRRLCVKRKRGPHYPLAIIPNTSVVKTLSTFRFTCHSTWHHKKTVQESHVKIGEWRRRLSFVSKHGKKDKVTKKITNHNLFKKSNSFSLRHMLGKKPTITVIDMEPQIVLNSEQFTLFSFFNSVRQFNCLHTVFVNVSTINKRRSARGNGIELYTYQGVWFVNLLFCF